MVHPHACGELAIYSIVLLAVVGSSPRMWGTLLPKPAKLVVIRFIPTHVGNSFEITIECVTDKVHPHACGELNLAQWVYCTTLGSSPRMWGTLIGVGSVGFFDWFIPTHVGNSGLFLSIPSMLPVHPHACGELEREQLPYTLEEGSSPRMWGTHR